MITKKNSATVNGYTLLETLIALSILLAVIVPFTSYLFKDLFFAKYQDKVTALCLIDQEIRTAQIFPKGISMIKRRSIAGKDWEIHSEISGTKLLKCKFTAKKNNAVIGEYWVMINNE
jgi:hypothetical protein